MSACVFNILNFSDEILLEIILHLNARERASLGNSCTKFYGLIFREKRFFRNLDFSEEGYLTSSTDVRQYFENETMYRHMKVLNLDSMCCSSPEPMLQDIRKATNLVEVNIIGIHFDHLRQLGAFLDPLVNLRKLSAGWPEIASPTEVETVEKSFNRLKHLTIRIDDFDVVHTFLRALLQYSQELEELFLLVVCFGALSYNLSSVEEILEELDLSVLPKLKVVAGYNINYFFLPLDQLFRQILPDHDRWTQFHLNWHGLLYYEKDVKVTPKMSSHIQVDEQPTDIEGVPVTRFLDPGYLLAYAIQIATGVDANDYCSFDQTVALSHPVMIKIKDIKMLLQNPGHQIAYIHMEHNLKQNCFTYLAVFPYLTKLVLHGIFKDGESSFLDSSEDEEEFEKLEEPNEEVISNPFFETLVENTPHLKDLTMYPKAGNRDESWDLTSLHLISGWKKLTTLFLAKIPITNGEFLIEIGKGCENLEMLRLEELGPSDNCCYKNELAQMLTHCRNLKDFSIEQNNFGQVSDLFWMFAETPKLRRLGVKIFDERNTFDNLVSPIEKLVRSNKLILLVGEFEELGTAVYDNLNSNLQRLKDELGRATFEFEIIVREKRELRCPSRNRSLEFAHKDLLHPHRVINPLYQLGFR